MDKYELIGKLALDEFERKEKLRKIIHQPAYKFYFGSILKIISFLVVIAWGVIASREGDVFFVFFIFAFLGLLLGEISRHAWRFDALVKLLETEKEESKKCEQVAPADGDSAVPEP